ncbi:hypothetical protein ACFVAV_34000 [Nocardia sp. NPDC057663]|uniref:hypothetical protein n=1 Tax=Nocardia sp. NPDC057663 TaxID=3346201 RepID=UPI003671BE07
MSLPNSVRCSQPLETFNVGVQDWNVVVVERGADNVQTRISAFRKTEHPAMILYRVGHGWTNNAETAVLYHANSEREGRDVGLTPTDLAKAIAGRLDADDRWVIVLVDACGSKRFSSASTVIGVLPVAAWHRSSRPTTRALALKHKSQTGEVGLSPCECSVSVVEKLACLARKKGICKSAYR